MAKHSLRIIGLGLLTGSRSLAVLASVSSRLAHRQPAGWRAPRRWMTGPGVGRLLRALSFGELLADKLPGTPDRIEPEALTGRALSGALTGALFSTSRERSQWFGLLIGAISALGGAYLGYHARRQMVEKCGLPDPVVALIEDAIVLGGAQVLLRR